MTTQFVYFFECLGGAFGFASPAVGVPSGFVPPLAFPGPHKATEKSKDLARPKSEILRDPLF